MSQTITGTLLRLARWPVKSAGGEFLARADIDRQGITGDRRYTVIDLDRDPPRHLTAAETPRLLRWKAVGRTLHGADGDRCVIAARDPDTGRKWPQLLRHLGHAHDLLFGIFAAPRADAHITLGDPVELNYD